MYRYQRAVVVSASLSAPTETAHQAASTLSSSTRNAIIAVSVIGSILAISATIWVLLGWKKQRALRNTASEAVQRPAKHFTVDLESAMEKPTAVFHLEPPTPFHGGWVPQIRTHRGEPVKDPSTFLKQNPSDTSASTTSSPTVSTPSSAKEKRKPSPFSDWKDKKTKAIGSEWSPCTPPPSYFIMNGVTTPSPNAMSTPPPPFKTHPNTPFNVIIHPTEDKSSKVLNITNPVRTRLSSAYQQTIRTSEQYQVKMVEQPFLPSLDDELALDKGETVQILEEYADNWCLVQKTGKTPSAKGVVPKFCLSD